jgi:hypothetical protein
MLKFVTKVAFKPPSISRLRPIVARFSCVCWPRNQSTAGTLFVSLAQHLCTEVKCHHWKVYLKVDLPFTGHRTKQHTYLEGRPVEHVHPPGSETCTCLHFYSLKKGASFSTLCNKCKYTFGPLNSDRPHTRAIALAKMSRRIVSTSDSSNFSQQLFGPIAQINEASGGGAGARRPAALSCYRALGLEARRGCRSSRATCTSGKT